MAKYNSSLTHARLKEVLHYNPPTGIFTRIIATANMAKVGEVAGGVASTGYIALRVDGVRYQAHRLAWLYTTGKWPKRDIDHVDHDKTNNAFSNLREVDRRKNSQNMKKRSSGYIGVCRVRGKWHVCIGVNYKTIHIGVYRTLFAAVYARHAANIKHGFHPNHGG